MPEKNIVKIWKFPAFFTVFLYTLFIILFSIADRITRISWDFLYTLFFEALLMATIIFGLIWFIILLRNKIKRVKEKVRIRLFSEKFNNMPLKKKIIYIFRSILFLIIGFVIAYYFL